MAGEGQSRKQKAVRLFARPECQSVFDSVESGKWSERAAQNLTYRTLGFGGFAWQPATVPELIRRRILMYS
jgi:hypothetical protein